MLFVFEGIDGVGKTTVSEKVLEMLTEKGIDAVKFFEPTNMKWGKKIRSIFEQGRRLTPEEETDMFMRDRKENVEKQIKPAINQGKVVLLDRYYFSTAAYQGAEGMDWKKIIKDNEAFCILPQCVFFFQLPPSDALVRIEQNGRKKTAPETLDTLSRIESVYYDIFFISDLIKYQIITLNASLKPERLATMITSTILKYISK